MKIIRTEDYIISKSNTSITNYLYKWPKWGVYDQIIVIHGASKSGKTHLAHIWANITNAKFISYNDIYSGKNIEIISSYNCFIIDDIEKLFMDEVNLLHFINMITQQKKYLLITSQNHPKDLSVKLPDLKSRLASFLEFSIEPIDDELFKSIAFKYFADKHLTINDKIINYMLSRVDRSFTSLKQIIGMIDKKNTC